MLIAAISLMMTNSLKAVLQTGLLYYFKLQGPFSVKELAEAHYANN
jgi:hypothetical protein